MSGMGHLLAPSGSADVQLMNGPTNVRGLSAQSIGMAGAFVLRDGFGPSAPGVFHVNLRAGESVILAIEPPPGKHVIQSQHGYGMGFMFGLYLDRVYGEPEVTVFLP